LKETIKSTSLVGQVFGDTYRIEEKIGSGGMGDVYLAEDTRLDRKVAVKVLPEEFASDQERLARFEQEAKAAAALNHPHIAAVFDVGFEEGGSVAEAKSDAPAEAKTDPSMDASAPLPAGGVHYIVQEYLQGQSLGDRLAKGALPLDRALDLATEVPRRLLPPTRQASSTAI